MNKYELLYIIAGDQSEEAREALIKKFDAFIGSKGGKVESADRWGMKKFAYPINFKEEGYYVLENITLPSSDVEEMNKLMLITDGIVRQMFVRK